eukprot:scaffold3256_cov114-Isochrysis_galbana.AAC.2
MLFYLGTGNWGAHGTLGDRASPATHLLSNLGGNVPHCGERSPGERPLERLAGARATDYAVDGRLQRGARRTGREALVRGARVQPAHLCQQRRVSLGRSRSPRSGGGVRGGGEPYPGLASAPTNAAAIPGEPEPRCPLPPRLSLRHQSRHKLRSRPPASSALARLGSASSRAPRTVREGETLKRRSGQVGSWRGDVWPLCEEREARCRCEREHLAPSAPSGDDAASHPAPPAPSAVSALPPAPSGEPPCRAHPSWLARPRAESHSSPANSRNGSAYMARSAGAWAAAISRGLDASTSARRGSPAYDRPQMLLSSSCSRKELDGCSKSAAAAAERRLARAADSTTGSEIKSWVGLCIRPARYRCVQWSRSSTSESTFTTPYLISRPRQHTIAL